MRKLFTIVALLLTFMMSSSAVAQTPEATLGEDFRNVDIEGVAGLTLDVDLDALMTDMEEPMSDETLPAAFSNAEYIDPATATAEDLVLPTDDLEFAEGSAAYNLDYQPEAQGMVIGFSSLNYIFVDGEITEDDMEDFAEGASEGLEDDSSGAEVSVEDIEINGITGTLISYELEDDGIISIVQMIALPVGNTMVLSMVVAASDDPSLSAGMVRTDAVDLLLAGVDHLGTTAEDAG